MKEQQFTLEMGDTVIDGIGWNKAMNLMQKNSIYPILVTGDDSVGYKFYISSKRNTPAIATMKRSD